MSNEQHETSAPAETETSGMHMYTTGDYSVQPHDADDTIAPHFDVLNANGTSVCITRDARLARKVARALQQFDDSSKLPNKQQTPPASTDERQHIGLSSLVGVVEERDAEIAALKAENTTLWHMVEVIASGKVLTEYTLSFLDKRVGAQPVLDLARALVAQRRAEQLTEHERLCHDVGETQIALRDSQAENKRLQEVVAQREHLAYEANENQAYFAAQYTGAAEENTELRHQLKAVCRQRDEQIAQMRPLVEALAELPDQLPLRVPTHQYLEAVERAQRIGDAVRQARTLVAQWKQDGGA